MTSARAISARARQRALAIDNRRFEERIGKVMRDCGITGIGRPVVASALALCDRLLTMPGDPAEIGATAARVIVGVMNEEATRLSAGSRRGTR